MTAQSIVFNSIFSLQSLKKLVNGLNFFVDGIKNALLRIGRQHCQISIKVFAKTTLEKYKISDGTESLALAQ